MSKKIARIVVVALALIVGLTSTALGDTYRVRATAGNEWSPDFRHILRGDSVRWKNPASLERLHDVKACPRCGGRDWRFYEELSPGEGVRKRFRRGGTYSYRCTLHSAINSSGECVGMCGVVHVQ